MLTAVITRSKAAIAFLSVVMLCACATSDLERDAAFDDACRAFGDNVEGETVVVVNDQSSRTRVGAVGIPATPSAPSLGVLAGPALITEAGGALAYDSGPITDIEARPCPNNQIIENAQ